MVHYLCASPKPGLEGCDALYNEICSLRERYNGNITHIYPFKKPSSKFPPFLYGLHNPIKLIKQDANHSINHVFASTLFNIPSLNLLRNPIVYNVAGSLNRNSKLPNERFLQRLSRIVVSNSRDKNYLESKGVNKVEIVKTGIDFTNKTIDTNPDLKVKGKLTLLLASSPWEMSQFESKGINLLLKVAQKMKNLKLILIWRGIHVTHIENLIKKYNVESSVTLINKKVEIKEYLQKADGVVLLANSPTIVKSYPHSLLEGLLSGKPVLVSKQIPIADFVKDFGCGLVIDSHETTELFNKLQFFYNYYPKLKSNSSQINRHRFNFNNMINAYGKIYDQVLLKSKPILNQI